MLNPKTAVFKKQMDTQIGFNSCVNLWLTAVQQKLNTIAEPRKLRRFSDVRFKEATLYKPKHNNNTWQFPSCPTQEE